MKKIVVIGASPNENRYSNKATQKLLNNNYEVVPLGIREGTIASLDIITERPELPDIHSVTMYVGKQRQPDWYDYILSLNPKRVIFNPGTENIEFMKLANKNGIETTQNCTLVMLSLGIY